MTQVFLYICLSLSIQGIDIITQRKGQPVCGGWDLKNVTSVLPKTMQAKT